MGFDADIALVVEGGYPYHLGGVSSWVDELIKASPQLRFHVIPISVSSQSRKIIFPLPDNVTGVTDAILDICPVGLTPRRARDMRDVRDLVQLCSKVLQDDDGEAFSRFIAKIAATGFGDLAILGSKPAWTTFEQVYGGTHDGGSLIDFFWTWRFFVRSLLAVVGTPLPKVRAYHAVSTGYAGLIGAFANRATGVPLVVTEHGIYTNERRIELNTADWIYDSGAAGFGYDIAGPPALRDVWLRAFSQFSRISYSHATVVTTQYRANQIYQRKDGVAEAKLRIIPNGIDAERFSMIAADTASRRPTVLMIGRIVAIKDVRTFILAMAHLAKLVPGVQGNIIGPEHDEPQYAAGCRELVAQLGLSDTINFLGRVPSVTDYLRRADVFVLTSISEAQPIALLEAAACGLPAVATDVGSCREIIEGFDDDAVVGRGGYVVQPCNPEATARALASVLEHEGRRAEMGRVMRQRANHLYHRDRIKKIYADLYAEVIDGKAPMEMSP